MPGRGATRTESMKTQPKCKRLRRACRSLDVTIVVADTDADTGTEQDAAATWITGHQERVRFGELYVRGDSLLVDARIDVPCKFFSPGLTNGQDSLGAKCRLYGFEGAAPDSKMPKAMRLSISEDTFAIVRKGRHRKMLLPLKKGNKQTNRATKKGTKNKSRALPVHNSVNPCVGAPCRTSDNKRGAACCRDLKLELLIPKNAKNKMALLKTRKSPFLCKVKRENKRVVEVEVISACGYLGPDGISCVLHDRVRPNGKNAKPQLCYDWPDFGKDEIGHKGCVFA